MSVIWNKVWFDLWYNKARTILAILSIAAGVFAIGSIFGMVDQMLSTIDAAHQATFPSHINMFLRDRIDHNTAIRLKSIEGLEDMRYGIGIARKGWLEKQNVLNTLSLARIEDFFYGKKNRV